MVPLTYYGSTYHCEVGVISRPSIKLAGVDSLEADFRFKTMGYTYYGRTNCAYCISTYFTYDR